MIFGINNDYFPEYGYYFNCKFKMTNNEVIKELPINIYVYINENKIILFDA